VLVGQAASNSSGAIVANPIAIGTGGAINGVAATVTYAGPSGAGSGLDQVNILLPVKLAGPGNVNLQLPTEGVAANPVQITIQ
jgi:uncharacterized protein (TIGR03437 family)